LEGPESRTFGAYDMAATYSPRGRRANPQMVLLGGRCNGAWNPFRLAPPNLLSGPLWRGPPHFGGLPWCRIVQPCAVSAPYGWSAL